MILDDASVVPAAEALLVKSATMAVRMKVFMDRI